MNEATNRARTEQPGVARLHHVLRSLGLPCPAGQLECDAAVGKRAMNSTAIARRRCAIPRVIEGCERHEVDLPTFEDRTGASFAAFRVPIGLGPGIGPSWDQVRTKLVPSPHQVLKGASERWIQGRRSR